MCDMLHMLFSLKNIKSLIISIAMFVDQTKEKSRKFNSVISALNACLNTYNQNANLKIIFVLNLKPNGLLMI